MPTSWPIEKPSTRRAAVGAFAFRTLDKYVFVPTMRSFTCADVPGISYPLVNNTVSTRSLLTTAFVGPSILIEVRALVVAQADESTLCVPLQLCEWAFVRAAMPHLSCTASLAVQMANSTLMSLKYLLGAPSARPAALFSILR